MANDGFQRLLLAAGLLDEEIAALIAEVFDVEHAKLARLANKDQTFKPVLGRFP